ncbi:hypothetical protein ACRAWG_08050 [Methylobacterium sp. P31]
MLTGTPEQHAKNAKLQASTLAKLATDRAVYEPLISSAEEKALWETSSGLWERYGASDRQMTQLVEQGRAAEALALIGSREQLDQYNRMRESPGPDRGSESAPSPPPCRCSRTT